MRNEPRETCTRVSCGSQRAKIVLRRPLAGLLLVSELSTSSNLILYRYRTKKFQLDLVSSLRLYTFGVSCASVPSDSRWSIRLIGVCTGDRSRKSFERRLSCNCCLHASRHTRKVYGRVSVWWLYRLTQEKGDSFGTSIRDDSLDARIQIFLSRKFLWPVALGSWFARTITSDRVVCNRFVAFFSFWTRRHDVAG